MNKMVEISLKRKIFYEMLLKILKLQQKEDIQIEFEDLKFLQSELNDFKNEFPRFNTDLITNIEDFLSTFKVTDKLTNPIFLKEIIERLVSFELKSSSEKDAIYSLIGLIKNRIGEIEGSRIHLELDENSLNQVLKDILDVSESLNSKIKSLYEEFIKKQALKEKDLNEILKFFDEIKKLNQFPEFQDKFKDFSRLLREKTAIYSFSQIKKSLIENKINETQANSLIQKILLPKLIQSIILFVINNLGPQTVESLNKKTKIQKDELFTGLVSLLDKKEIEIVGKDEEQPIYSKIKFQSKTIEISIKNLKLITNLRNKLPQKAEIFDKIIKNLIVFKKHADSIEQFDEKIFENDILKLKNNVNELTDLISSISSEEAEQMMVDRIDAMIEALNLYRLKLTFEKEDGLKKISKEVDEKVSRLILDSMDQDFERGQIISSIKKKGPSTILEISRHTGLAKDKIYSHIINLRGDNKVKIIGEKEGYDLIDVDRVKNEEDLLLESLLSALQNFLNLQKNYMEAILNIEFNLDKINKLLEKFVQNLEGFPKIIYLNQSFGLVFYQKYMNYCKKVQVTLSNIKGKVRIKKTELNFDELVPIVVPSTEEKYSHLIEPKQLIGFGTIKSSEKKCIACRSCQDICEESAVTLKNVWNLPGIFELSEVELNELPETKSMLIQTIKRIAIKKPSNMIKIPLGAIGYGKPEFEPIKCIACKKCVERCPNKAIEFEEVWNFPEIIKSASTTLMMDE